MQSLLAMSVWETAMTLFIIFVCVLLILVVLLQKGRGGGLAGAFGGSGGGGGAFGAKTGDVFTWVTVVLAVVFLLLNVAGNHVMVFEAPQQNVIKVPAPDTATDAEAPADAQSSSDEKSEETVPAETATTNGEK